MLLLSTCGAQNVEAAPPRRRLSQRAPPGCCRLSPFPQCFHWTKLVCWKDTRTECGMSHGTPLALCLRRVEARRWSEFGLKKVIFCSFGVQGSGRAIIQEGSIALHEGPSCPVIFVRGPENFFLYTCHFGEDVLSCHITSHPPLWGLLVAIGDGLGQMVCSNGPPMYKSIWNLGQDVLSCHVTSHSPLWGAIGGYWCWPGMNGLLKWSTNVQKYMASGPRCHITSCHIPLYEELLVLAWDEWSAQMVHQCTKVYGIWAKMSCHIMSHHVPPPYLSNC